MTEQSVIPPAERARQVREQSARVVEVLREVDPTAPVPHCPGWTALDLAQHLTQVHHFWAQVLTSGALTDEEVGPLEDSAQPRAEDLPAALDELASATTSLVAALSTMDPAQPAWSWHPPDQSAGFTMRMQSHEATVHRVDAEQTAGMPLSPIEDDLAWDGIDHVVDVMMAVPEWAELQPAGVLQVRALRSDGTGGRVGGGYGGGALAGCGTGVRQGF